MTTVVTSPLTRIYVSGPLAPGNEVSLQPPQAHHVLNVLRMAAGDAVTVFNGEGGEYAGVIARAGRSGVVVSIQAARACERESPLSVTLVQGVSRGSRMDYTVQKAVELGVARVEPVLTRRGVVRLDAAGARQKSAHWQAVAIAACEQSGRNRVPGIAPALGFPEWLGCWRERRGDALGLLLDPRAGHVLRERARPPAGVYLLAGPEGGLTGEEREAALDAGFEPLKLGPRVLRTETAALAALAAMQALWGDF